MRRDSPTLKWDKQELHMTGTRFTLPTKKHLVAPEDPTCAEHTRGGTCSDPSGPFFGSLETRRVPCCGFFPPPMFAEQIQHQGVQSQHECCVITYPCHTTSTTLDSASRMDVIGDEPRPAHLLRLMESNAMPDHSPTERTPGLRRRVRGRPLPPPPRREGPGPARSLRTALSV